VLSTVPFVVREKTRHACAGRQPSLVNGSQLGVHTGPVAPVAGSMQSPPGAVHMVFEVHAGSHCWPPPSYAGVQASPAGQSAVEVQAEPSPVMPEELDDELDELDDDELDELDADDELPDVDELADELDADDELPDDDALLEVAELLVPQSQAPQLDPSALQAWPPWHAPGPTHVWVAPGVQTLLPPIPEAVVEDDALPPVPKVMPFPPPQERGTAAMLQASTSAPNRPATRMPGRTSGKAPRVKPRAPHARRPGRRRALAARKDRRAARPRAPPGRERGPVHVAPGVRRAARGALGAAQDLNPGASYGAASHRGAMPPPQPGSLPPASTFQQGTQTVWLPNVCWSYWPLSHSGAHSQSSLR
jgi:hypothetical protein